MLPAARDAGERLARLAGAPLPGEDVARPGPGGDAELGPERLVLEETLERGSDRALVLGLDEEARLAVDHRLRHSARARPERGDAAEGRLDVREAERLELV